MTRDMLIRLLDDHTGHWEADEDAHSDHYQTGLWFCTCGTWFDTHTEWSAHVADLIQLGYAT